jgi:uncharacterized membrane protein YqgA involved in biofilm formation
MYTSSAQAAKLHVIDTLGLSKDALHIYVGLSVFVIVWLVMRRRPNSLFPLAAVLAIAILGEIVDMRDDIVGLGHWRWRASLHDVLNTCFWPAVLWALIRTRLIFPKGK